MTYQIGDRAGDYEIVGVLGAGGMGKVYKVRNVISDRVEAMKVLLPNLEADPHLADRFTREIKVQASLDHPNIAGLHTALRVDNQLIMVIEFVEGTTIETELRKGPIAIEQTLAYVRQVLAALAHAHARGVVHRDIKPANIMLTASGTVKLMDFGIARIAADRQLTRTGQTVGSLYYMSPEQIQGAEDLDGRSDVYSLGVTLYEMCTGRRPFRGESDYEIMAAHLNSTPIAPIEIDSSIPAALSDIILMSIARDRAQRFQTADAFLAAINILTPALPLPRTATLPQPAASAAAQERSSGRRALYMAIGSIVTVIVLALAALQGPKLFRPSSAASPTIPATAPPSVQTPRVETGPQRIPREKQRPLPNEPNLPAPPVPRGMPAVEPPPQVTQNEPPPFQPPQQSVAPAVPGVDTKQLEDLRERFLLLATRANSLRGSLNAMRKQMESLNLNAEFTTREQRMEAYLDQAEEALKAHNTASGRNRLDAAERVIEELEKKFGR